jgi:hypothetical protein
MPDTPSLHAYEFIPLIVLNKVFFDGRFFGKDF